MSAAGLSDCAEPQVRGAEGLPVEGLGADRAAEAVLQDCRLAPHDVPIELREPYDNERERPALPRQGPRAHEQGQVGAEVAQGVRSRSSVIQASPASWSRSMVRSRCRQAVQATTEASEADQAGLSCRARQTWWITLIVGPLSLRSGTSGARPSHWPARSERSERPLGEGAAEMAPGAIQRRSCREPIQGRPVGRPGDRRVRRVRPGARAGRLRAKTDAH